MFALKSAAAIARRTLQGSLYSSARRANMPSPRWFSRSIRQEAMLWRKYNNDGLELFHSGMHGSACQVSWNHGDIV
jgi:hypothetical protein